jgi:hypothetical protein
MRFLVIDEDMLNLEGWADALEELADRYEQSLKR